jgi:hypothetical protein
MNKKMEVGDMNKKMEVGDMNKINDDYYKKTQPLGRGSISATPLG